MRTPSYLTLLILVSGGTVQFFQKIAGANRVYAPSYMVVSALSLAVFGVIIHIFHGQRFQLSGRMAALGALGGVLGGIYLLAMVVAFRLGGDGSVIFPISGLGVMIPVVLAFIVYREPVTAKKLIGIVVGVGAILILSG